jgi:adenylate cyclase, class 2
MATEIELKARLDDSPATEERVSSFAAFSHSFDRSDSYFNSAAGEDFRLRRSPDRESAIVTMKKKSIHDGIETNDEQEFSVLDPDAFTGFALRIGCSVYARKHKKGRAYRSDGITIEITTVDGLGDFIEIEKLIDSPDPASAQQAEKDIRALLARAGVSESNIEPRNYIELLKNI